MNTDRPDSNEDRDPRVSDAYRDLARERPGATIDEAIMREARRSARRGFRRSANWFRPLAWAATIGLCLAVVIEISSLPDYVDSDSSDELASPSEFAVPENMPDDIADAAARQSTTKDAATPERAEKAERKRQSSPAASTDAVSPASRAADTETRSDAESALGTSASSELQDLRMLREAEERARVQSGNVAEPVGARFAPVPAEAADTEHYCDETVTADPHDWLECIEELERDGLYEAARIERERFARTFPEPEFLSPDR